MVLYTVDKGIFNFQWVAVCRDTIKGPATGTSWDGPEFDLSNLNVSDKTLPLSVSVLFLCIFSKISKVDGV